MSEGYSNLIQRYYDWNIDGIGDDHGRWDVWTYHQCRFFNNGYPSSRIVTAADGSKVRLMKNSSGNSWFAGKHTHRGNSFHSFHTPDIGVFSIYEGDWLPEDQMHKRAGYIMLQQVRMYTATTMEKFNGKKLQERNQAAHVQEGLKRFYDRFDKYSGLFGLGWEGLPTTYQSELAGEIDRLIRAYNDPKAVIKRERAAARKLAKKTLGL